MKAHNILEFQNPSLDLKTIASKQKMLIRLTVPWVAFALTPLPACLIPLETIAFWMVHGSCIVVCYQLAQLLRKNPIVWGCLALVPFVNLFAIARLAAQASKVLKQNGIPSGLTGI